MPTLTIQLPGLPSVDHILRDEMMTIGRMKGNTIALDDASVSVSHAKITRKGAEFYLKDLNSTNGTMLNGQSINEARLKDGDQLKFGEVIALYHGQPEFISNTPAQIPATPAPPPAPVLTIASSTFVSKSLATQAPPSKAQPPGYSTQSLRAKKKKTSWLIPVIGGSIAVAGVAIAAVVYFGNDTKPASNLPPSVPVKNSSSNNAAAKANSTSSQKNPASAENKNINDLKKALKANDPADRRRAAAALHALGSGAKEAIPELRTALNDTDADVRMWAALALINNKSYDKATIPILIQVLHHDNSMLRQVSCLSLALIPYDEADKETVVSALTETANKDDDDEVRKAAVSALKIITPERMPGDK